MMVIYHGGVSAYFNVRGDSIGVNIERYTVPLKARIKYDGESAEPRVTVLRWLKAFMTRNGLLLVGDRKLLLLIQRYPELKLPKDARVDAFMILQPSRDKARIIEGKEEVELEPGDAYDLTHRVKVRRIHTMHVERRYFRYLIEGSKKVEGRLYDERRRRLTPGDHLRLIDESGAEAYFLIKEIRIYPGFREMLAAEGVKNVLPDADSIEEGISTYRRFYGEREENLYGVCAIHLDPV